MKTNPIECPCCGRPFSSILDYPRVEVVAFQRLPLPEAMDTMSAAALDKQLARRRKELAGGRSEFDLHRDGINMTPAIQQASDRDEVQQYFQHLDNCVGREVAPQSLLPPWKPDGRFKWAYPVADTGLFLSLTESNEPTGSHRQADVLIHSRGPNLGSAGGPTLQPLGSRARLEYVGLLKS